MEGQNAGDPMTVDFFVPGVPAPGGSKSYMGQSKSGRAIIRDSSKRAPAWKDSVNTHAIQAMNGRPVIDKGVPLVCNFEFIMPRPQGHYRTGKHEGELKDWAINKKHTTKPDTLKLQRPTEDAMTGVVWTDDSQVFEQSATKRYAMPGEVTGVRIRVTAASIAGKDE